MTEKLNKTLDRLRLRWLESRIDAGLGRIEPAIARVDRVCEEFLHTDPPLPYDAALAGLDLARYWLSEGNAAAVQRLAVPLERIFRAKGIDREAAASLRLFCEAARREAATVEMAQKVKASVERAGTSTRTACSGRAMRKGCGSTTAGGVGGEEVLIRPHPL